MQVSIYNSENLELYHDEDESCIYQYWSMNSNQTEEEYKTEMLNLIQAIEGVKHQRTLVDSSSSSFVISPMLQEWTATTIFPKSIALGLKRVAFIVPDEIFALVSIEQTMQEGSGQHFMTKYFNNNDTAIEWLFSNEAV